MRPYESYPKASIRYEPLYEHLPLLKHEDIRLLRLLPPTNEESGISGELLHSNLEECPPYEALSYTWGDRSRTHPIAINGGEFRITANLYSALLHLRHSSSVRLLWVDAVCINMRDLEERNAQATLTVKKFHQAQQVVVWLGEAADGSDEAMDIIHDLSTTTGIISMNTVLQQTIIDLLRRPWF